MTYIFSGAVSLAVAMLAFLLQKTIKENERLKEEQRRKDEEEKKQAEDRRKALENGVVCLLRKELISDHEKWTKKGFITSSALEHGLLMYDAYKALGGNGMIDHMKEEVESLHIRKDDSKWQNTQAR